MWEPCLNVKCWSTVIAGFCFRTQFSMPRLHLRGIQYPWLFYLFSIYYKILWRIVFCNFSWKVIPRSKHSNERRSSVWTDHTNVVDTNAWLWARLIQIIPTLLDLRKENLKIVTKSWIFSFPCIVWIFLLQTVAHYEVQ